MSEEILEQQSEEELEEAKLAAVKSSGRKIKVAEGELPVSYTHLTLPTTPYV